MQLATQRLTQPERTITLERLSIELTRLCNKGCCFCYNGSSSQGETVWQVDDLVAFVLDAAEHGVRAVSFGGGEPLQYPGLFDVLAALEGKLFRSFTTNGLLLQHNWVEVVASRPDKVHVSIHFPDHAAEVTRVMAQVQQLQAAGIRSGINLLVQQSKLTAVAKIVQRLHASGITNDRIIYLPMRHQDTPTAHEIAALAGGQFQSMTCLTHCHRSPRFCSINWQGEVAWCSYTRSRMTLQKLSYQHLVDTLSLIDLEYCGNA
ncbi:MAG TPA: radical SAM protein [Gemmatales bacterium]|nr:radical SAM protein [Gemmatales bacterium]